ncbi:unnamed protein product [Aspergillus oryzae]|uniref:Unnamed protein product n=1 Tax=Aspergillus oryzae TaxID=5062 RepID=A0AAN4YL15_ASPOZ|nr:unnamed protein product [Aspergillus oryzae]
MNMAFKGVYTISNIAVSAGNHPGPVTEGHVSNLLELTPSDSLACTFPISTSMVDRCGRRCVYRHRAQQRITEVVYFGELIMSNDDSIKVQVRERRQWGNKRVDVVKPDGDLNRCEGQLEQEISLPGPLLGSNIASNRLTARYLYVNSCLR